VSPGGAPGTAPPELIAIHTNMPGTIPPEIVKALAAGSPPPSAPTRSAPPSRSRSS